MDKSQEFYNIREFKNNLKYDIESACRCIDFPKMNELLRKCFKNEFLQEISCDYDLMLNMARTDLRYIDFVANELLNDKEFILDLVHDCGGMCFDYIPTKWRQDDDVIIKSLWYDNEALAFIPKEKLDDRKFLLKCIDEDEESIKYVSERFLNDEEFILEAVSTNGGVLEFLPNEYQDTKKIVLAAIENWGYAICSASDRLKNHRDVWLAAFKSKDIVAKELYSYVPEKFKTDKEFIKEIMEEHPCVKWYLPKKEYKEAENYDKR